jgi:hypothetical protein
MCYNNSTTGSAANNINGDKIVVCISTDGYYVIVTLHVNDCIDDSVYHVYTTQLQQHTTY